MKGSQEVINGTEVETMFSVPIKISFIAIYNTEVENKLLFN